ncbi:MAG TPA: hypothetical protein VFP97_15170 [Chitinophagaceae bacterium]|nr:hypothetical protein [Chitinophagaceae bacterium]
MERQHNNGDFEKLLRDNANQYRMYPSEKVWEGVHSALHTRRRWFGISTAIVFLITTSIVSIIIYNGNPETNNLEQQEITAPVNSQVASIEKQESPKYTPAINRATPKLNKAQNVEELVFGNQVFDLPNTVGESTLSTNHSNETTPDETVIIFIPVVSETGVEDIVNADPSLERFDSEIRTENSEISALTSEKTIADENGLSDDAENKIKEAISALASQNAPLTKSNRHAKVTAQVYFTPTVSYRKLSENKRVYNSGAFYVPIIDLNNVVKHKPGMGVEFGIEGRYHVNDKFSIKTGFQFNINRYDIRAYTHTTEIATVALNTGSGFDSMATTTNYRNFSVGAEPNWLENFYFQAGVPIGIELIITDNKNLQWGISGTIQPTYVVGDRAYMISSDYKNYARFPDLMRRWNISTGVGSFVSYSTGKIKWQVGPHVRYQHLSSFVSALTVKEKLFAIGLKVGATLNK